MIKTIKIYEYVVLVIDEIQAKSFYYEGDLDKIEQSVYKYLKQHYDFRIGEISSIIYEAEEKGEKVDAEKVKAEYSSLKKELLDICLDICLDKKETNLLG